MDINRIRNFSIIAHIDHGKSTLADRLLQITGTVSARDMADQVLDDMDLEREKGVTIKASAVQMKYTSLDGHEYELNLIDTPGHVDFGYEVSRALAACEGALLVVDAAQGMEAQTIANMYAALEADLEIIPILNKIDLPAARPDEIAQNICDLLGTPPDSILRISAKDGENIQPVLEKIIQEIPPPEAHPGNPLRALIFDSHYNSYQGVVAYIRIFDGIINKKDKLHLMAAGKDVEPFELGVFSPAMTPMEILYPGEVGYIATGLKSVHDCRVGDTITYADPPALQPLPGYIQAKPMVFAGFFPVINEEYGNLRDALEKLQLNDAALVFEPESSPALNLGFRCGFLGMFHMEIIQERLEREYNLDIIATAPSVKYRTLLRSGEVIEIDSPADLPDRSLVEEIQEPWMDLQVFLPLEYYGSVMELVTTRRGTYLSQHYPSPSRVQLNFQIPLSELIVDFFDYLKSATRGYASMDYSFAGYRKENLVKLEILVNGEPVDGMASIVHRDKAYRKGKVLVNRLKEIIPPHHFAVPIQASAGGKIISRTDVKALRKDVTAKLYGGDVTRKRKLLENQKAGRKRLKRVGNVDLPQEAFMAVLRLDDD
ncbi:MAG: translation elongation factor 4 [Anaerolineales bacterium]|nr:translation elongation factor 4 [Anaerolineales bacterium]